MAVSKVVYKESANATPVTWIDATSATAAASDILSPKTAMLANGVVTTGTGTGGGSTLFEYDYTYTVSESWESGKTGETMAAAVMNGHSVEDALAYCMILRNNTSTSSYRADAIIVSNQSGVGWLYRNNYGMAVSLGSSGQATQGTLVDLYVAKIPS